MKAVYEIQCAFFMSTFKSVARKFEYSWSKTRTFQGGPELNLKSGMPIYSDFTVKFMQREQQKKIV